MKNLFTKIVAALTAFVAVFILSSTMVFAADPALIDPAQKGSITIHKFDQSGVGVGVGKSHNGTELADTSELGKPLGGITFTVTLIPGATASSTIQDAMDHINSGDPLTQFTVTTDRNGVAAFTNLELGVYFVQEVVNSGIVAPIVPFLVSIPMTDPVDASTWIYNIHAYPKNIVIKTSISKEVLDELEAPTNSITSDVGETVTWRINPSIPADIASIELTNGGYFDITDDLDARLDYVSTSVILADVSGLTTHTFTSGVDFTLTEPAIPSAGGTIKVDFNLQAGIDLLKAALQNAETIRITVTTAINKTALEDLSQSIINTATLSYKNDIDDPSEPINPDPETIPEVVLGGVALYKWYTDDVDGAKALPGATFSIYETQDNAKNGIPIKKSGVPLTLTSDADGYVYFSGEEIAQALGIPLKGTEKFYLLENKAPTGFELLNVIVEVQIGKTVKVENVKLSEGFTLPITGGTGTLLYIIIGVVLIGASAGIFIFSKAKNRKSKKA